MSATAQAVLQTRQLSVRLGDHTVLQGVDLQIQPATWTCIVGPNGAGKSTLLRALAGLQAFEGEVHLLGKPLHGWPARERAQRLSWLGQNEAGADDLTVYDVAMLGRLPYQAWLAAPDAQDRRVVEAVLRQTQVWDLRERSLGALSGGERQRALLARALAVQAPMVLMDEPLASLDPPHQSDWLALVKRLVREGVTVVSVLHELNVALQADALLVLQHGRVQCQGPCDDPATRQALEAVFEQRIQLHALTVDGMGRWVALSKDTDRR